MVFYSFYEEDKMTKTKTQKLNGEVEENWTLPPDERGRHVGSEKLIIMCIKDKKITYPAEIVAETGFSRQTVFDRLAHMRTRGDIKRVNITTLKPPEELRERLPELWALGLKGDAIKRMSWYMINDDKEVEEKTDDSFELKLKEEEE